MKDIFGYKGYKVNEYGEVYSFKKHNPLKLKPHIDKYGYEVYRLTSDENERKAYKGHRIVANTFLKNEENLPQVNHIDGNKRNNFVENLEWVSGSENIKHAWDTGLIKGSPYGIEIKDIKENKIVSYFNGYEKLSEITGLTKKYAI